MTDHSIAGWLGFRKKMQNLKGYDVVSPAGTEMWEFGLSSSGREDRVDVHVESEGPGEWARNPEAIEWFNGVMRPLGVEFGKGDGYYGSFMCLDSARAQPLERELLRHGFLRSWRVRTFHQNLACTLVEDVPPCFEHEEYFLNLRSLPGEDHSKVRYVEFVACGPHEDGRHGVKALLLMGRKPNRSGRWLDREIEARGIACDRVPTEVPSVHVYALEREPALDLWRAAARLDAKTIGVTEEHFTDAQASWTFEPWRVSLRRG
jgi:hypothetical protein